VAIPSSKSNPFFFHPVGETGQIIQQVDWSKTPVGAMADWPTHLQTTLNLMLPSKFPMFLWWGEEHVQFYNDAYRALLGSAGKHPAALGQRGEDCWQEIWPTIQPLMEQVVREKEAVWLEDQLIPIYRNGRLDEVYWTFSYSPVFGENQQVDGILVVCTETTKQVVSTQRLRTLRDIAADTSESRTVADTCETVVQVLAKNPSDLPFVLPYYLDETGTKLEVCRFSDLPEGFPQEAREFSIADTASLDDWHILEVYHSKEKKLAEDLKSLGSAYPACEKAMALPLFQQGQPYPFGVLLVGINAQKPFDSGYQEFLDMVAASISTAVANAKSYEAERRLKEILTADSHFKELLLQAPIIMGLLKGEDMVIEAANDLILQVWGKTKAVIGQKLNDALPELEGQAFPALLLEVYRTGVPFRAYEYETFMEHEGQLRKYYFDFVYHPYREPDGSISGVIAIATDVTEQVEARRNVEASEQKFRNLLAQSPMAICILKTPDFIIESANDVILEVWGKGKDVIGKPLLEAVPETAAQGAIELLRGVYETGTPFFANEMKFLFERENGQETLYFSFVYQPFRELNGEISGVTVLATEVTPQALAHQQLAKSEAALRESEERLRLAIENGEMGTWDLDIAANTVQLSARTQSFFGFHSDKPLPLELLLACIHPDDLPQVTAAIENALDPASIGKYELEQRIVNQADGTQRLIRASGQAFRNEKGEPIHLIGTVLDVTEQRKVRELLEQEIEMRTLALKQANQLLQQTNQTFEHAEQIGKFCSFAYNYDSGQLTFSDNFYRMINLESGGLGSIADYHDYIFPEDKNYVSELEEMVIGKRIPTPMVYRLMPRQGDMIWVRSTGKIFTDEDGATWLIGTLQDITEAQNREAELRQQKEFVEMLIDAYVDNIIVVDTEVRYVLANKKALETVNMTTDELIGQKLLDLFPTSTKAYHDIQTALTGQHVHIPFHHSMVTGRIYDYHYIPLWKDGKVNGILCVSHDNTEFVQAQKKVQEMEQKNKELEEFAYLASHDLQEPLYTIKSFAELLEEELELTGETEIYLSFMKESVNRMGDLIQDLLEHSLIGSHGGMELVDLNKTVASVLSDLQATIAEANASITIDELPAVQGHPVELRLLFQNLVSNAIKFRQPDLPPVVHISSEKLGHLWRFSVSDNGIGIAPAYHDRIFIIFQRLHPKHEYEGTGIGLAQCKKIVELHGGKLWLESQPGEGSKFNFTLPIQE
jgi:PAS domain S-box-containing protein